ncbi:hypothetical protein [Pedobacter sp.]|uniref:hypothetical protein n=1 Tax=Pedobacter sp. TaxID=1411316 RepID=UPI0031D813C2
MKLRKKYELWIVAIFMCVFASKMVISAAPMFFKHLDEDFMVSVIMQLENENNGDEKGKSSVKFVDYKMMFQKIDLNYVHLDLDCGVPSSFIEHSRRYVDPYHPSVPTPPPNFS